MGVDNSVPFTLTLDDNEIIEDVLGKDKNDVEKGEDEDEDDTQAEKVTRKEVADAQKICQVMFIYFSTYCYEVSLYVAIHIYFLIRWQSCKQADIRSYTLSHHTKKFVTFSWQYLRWVIIKCCSILFF